MAPFVVADVGKTGAFVSLSCYYHGKGTGTAIPVLDAFSVGGVTVVHPPGCFNNGHIVETDHPAMNDLTDEVMNSGALLDLLSSQCIQHLALRFPGPGQCARCR